MTSLQISPSPYQRIGPYCGSCAKFIPHPEVINQDDKRLRCPICNQQLREKARGRGNLG